MTQPNRPDPDPFQVELARLAGLDPSIVVEGSLAVDFERDGGETTATLTARVAVQVDPSEVTRLAMEYDRIRPASA